MRIHSQLQDWFADKKISNVFFYLSQYSTLRISYKLHYFNFPQTLGTILWILNIYISIANGSDLCRDWKCRTSWLWHHTTKQTGRLFKSQRNWFLSDCGNFAEQFLKSYFRLRADRNSHLIGLNGFARKRADILARLIVVWLKTRPIANQQSRGIIWVARQSCRSVILTDPYK